MTIRSVLFLINRRCVCAASRSRTVSSGITSQSSQGDRWASGAGGLGVCRAQIICIHVERLFERVLMTMSPSRNGKPSQRALSSSDEV
jgi:hypothetical protein